MPKSSDSDTKFRGLLREPRRIGGEVVAGSRCDDDDNFYIQESCEGYEEDEEDTRALPLLQIGKRLRGIDALAARVSHTSI